MIRLDDPCFARPRPAPRHLRTPSLDELLDGRRDRVMAECAQIAAAIAEERQRERAAERSAAWQVRP